MSYIFYTILLVFAFLLFGEFLVFDEEFILITSVLLFLGASYNTVSGFLVDFLADRAAIIRKNFKTIFAIKILTLKTTLDTYHRINNSNIELLNVLRVVHLKLDEVKAVRIGEVENFLGYIVNNQLNVILLEKLNFIKNIYVKKISLFFSNLLLDWRAFEFRNLLEIKDLHFFKNLEDLEKSSNLIGFKKLNLLPLSILRKQDLMHFNTLGILFNMFRSIIFSNDFVFSYIVYLYIVNLKKTNGN